MRAQDIAISSMLVQASSLRVDFKGDESILRIQPLISGTKLQLIHDGIIRIIDKGQLQRMRIAYVSYSPGLR